ncbi:hypothetical protein GCM10027079_04290 [Sediminivirga luteola]|uniref:D-inositol 3-phosphate glycosyltransferase n=1 Tax=Sediminivirga luteola TaxID=1774748 RepID=A0A8J2XEP2_9MICO|nr:hypothetical protein GCM10011333_10390 [Sediminivirga luteola]
MLKTSARALEAAAYKGSRHVIALSPGMAAGVKRTSPRTPVTIVPNASDFDEFAEGRLRRSETRRELGWGDSETVITYAGSFGSTYDVPWLVELAAELRHWSDNYRVVIFGDGTASAAMRARATELGLDTKELLPGARPKSEIARILPAADFAVSTMTSHPALEVNSLNKVFDALAASTPVIFNHSGWLPDLLDEKGAGIKLSRNPEAAAANLHQLLISGFDRHAASQAAYNLGKTHFDRDTLFKKFRDVLEDAAADL